MRKIINNKITIAAFFILLNLLCFLSINKVIPQSDDKVYSDAAIKFSENKYKELKTFKEKRAGIVIPLGLIYKLNKNELLWTGLLPFLCSNLLLIFAFLKFETTTASLFSVLWIFNPIRIIYSNAYYPEIFLTTTAFIGLYYWYCYITTAKIKHAIIFMLFFIGSFFIKEIALLLLPGIAAVALLNKKWKAFIVIAASLAGIAVVDIFINGSIVEHYRLINTLHNSEIQEKLYNNNTILVSRLTIEPLQLLLANPSYAFLFIFSGTAVIVNFKNIFQKSKLENTLAILLAILMITLWFGSSSFTQYAPIPYIERMWMLLLPFMIYQSCIGIIQANNFKKYLIYYCAGFTACTLTAIAFNQFKISLLFFFSAATTLLILSNIIHGKYSKTLLLLTPVIAYSIYFLINN